MHIPRWRKALGRAPCSPDRCRSSEPCSPIRTRLHRGSHTVAPIVVRRSFSGPMVREAISVSVGLRPCAVCRRRFPIADLHVLVLHCSRSNGAPLGCQKNRALVFAMEPGEAPSSSPGNSVTHRPFSLSTGPSPFEPNRQPTSARLPSTAQTGSRNRLHPFLSHVLASTLDRPGISMIPKLLSITFYGAISCYLWNLHVVLNNLYGVAQGNSRPYFGTNR